VLSNASPTAKQRKMLHSPRSEVQLPKNTIAKKLSQINKKIKSFFFGESQQNEEEVKPEIEVKADYRIPKTIQQTPSKVYDEYGFKTQQTLKRGRSLKFGERPKLQALFKTHQFDAKVKLQLEIEKMREQLAI
jgi:hypothetical protein